MVIWHCIHCGELIHDEDILYDIKNVPFCNICGHNSVNKYDAVKVEEDTIPKNCYLHDSRDGTCGNESNCKVNSCSIKIEYIKLTS